VQVGIEVDLLSGCSLWPLSRCGLCPAQAVASASNTGSESLSLWPLFCCGQRNDQSSPACMRVWTQVEAGLATRQCTATSPVPLQAPAEERPQCTEQTGAASGSGCCGPRCAGCSGLKAEPKYTRRWGRTARARDGFEQTRRTRRSRHSSSAAVLGDSTPPAGSSRPGTFFHGFNGSVSYPALHSCQSRPAVSGGTTAARRARRGRVLRRPLSTSAAAESPPLEK
jgi:hypothetical protein